jgi:polyhydroxyalkanoate synthase subunit PhaC
MTALADDITPDATRTEDLPWRWDAIDRQVRDRYADAVFHVARRFDRGLIGKLDQIGLGPSLARLGAAWALHPMETATALRQWTQGSVRAGWSAAARAVGADVAPQVPTERDKRFTDPAWDGNAFYWWLRQQYLLADRAAADLVDGADLKPADRAKAAFAMRTLLDAVSPSNCPATNPAVIKKALDTGGLSLAKGFRTFVRDLATNGGQPRQVAEGVYQVGRDLAVTPGKVVFRNDLMELIQYSPTTETVHEIPLLFSPPWINKYYIMDLAPGRSLVQWAVDHGHTVFLISYRNPDESMRSVKMDDYLLSGPITALDVITSITGSEKVNLLGLCLGGTLTMATLAYLDATGQDRINNATFLNTLIDFSEPGLMGVFADERSVEKLEKTMARTGFLPAESMRRTFDLMRGQDLIWNYVVSNWLMGEEPPAFDILTWNADSTRMPADMHSFYLRSCYLENQLARGEMELAGQQLDLSTVDQDLYFLAAEQDHIAPWRSSYAGARLPSGDVRFVLSNSGHIAGIVNPPSPKSRHYVGASSDLPANPDKWLSEATMHPITWWEDWTAWIGKRAGGERKPPAHGNDKYPVLGDAPGTYVYGS